MNTIPEILPTCRFKPPPVPTIYWDDGSWKKWIAMCCPCEAHSTWREQEKVNGSAAAP